MLEDTNETDELGKWLSITDSNQIKDTMSFIDKELKDAYYRLDIENLARFQFHHFPHPWRSDINRTTAINEMTRYLKSTIPTTFSNLYKKAPEIPTLNRFKVTFTSSQPLSNSSPRKNAWYRFLHTTENAIPPLLIPYKPQEQPKERSVSEKDADNVQNKHLDEKSRHQWAEHPRWHCQRRKSNQKSM